MSTQCSQTVTEYFAAIRSLDVERFVNVFAPDGVTHDPVGTPEHRGSDAIRAFFSGIVAAVATLDLAEQDVVVCGNSAAVKWTGAGIGRNGKPVSFDGIDVIDCNEAGKITLVRAFWNPGPVMAILQS
jgi:steroid delta-isomerase